MLGIVDARLGRLSLRYAAVAGLARGNRHGMGEKIGMKSPVRL